MFKYVILCLLVTSVLCEKNYNGGYTRIKRGKYNSPPRYFDRPPPSSSYQGWISFTPPPGYMIEDGPAYPGPPFPGSSGPPFPGSSGPPFPGISGPPVPGSAGPPSFSGSPYSGNSRPPKVSKPQSDGLGEEDISNLIKHLSKSDLDKIVKLTGRDKNTEKYEKDPFDKFNDFNPTKNEIKYSPSDKLISDNYDYFEKLVQEMEAESKFKQIEPVKENNFVSQPIPVNNYQNTNEYNNLDTEESMLKQQYINIGNVNTDSVAEVNMPRPLNLRGNDDFEISFTKNVPQVIKSDNYELKNFGELPVMNYDSKLDTLSSYHVPHYTVTSQAKPSSYSTSQTSSYSSSASYGSKIPPLEAAPPPSAAKSQSDAHLKAVKIWSHRSTGTAYTLHDDGTLSLEKSGRPKGRYGYP